MRFKLGIEAEGGGFNPPLGLTGSHLGVLVATLCLWREKRHCFIEGAVGETPQPSLRPQLSRPWILRKGSITPNVLKLMV